MFETCPSQIEYKIMYFGGTEENILIGIKWL